MKKEIENIIRTKTEQEETSLGVIFGYGATFYEYKYSTKTGFNVDKLIFMGANFILTPNKKYCYFARRQQPNNNYYICVIDTDTLKTDLITYSGNREQAKNIIREMKNDSAFNNPEAIKYRFYNGSGDCNLFLH